MVAYPDWYYGAWPWYMDVNEVVHPGGEPWDVDAQEVIYGEPYLAEGRLPPGFEEEIWQIVQAMIADREPPRPIFPGTYVGWSQPPRPTDVVVSFDPKASRKDQARSVLYDYYHDDPLRYWSDNEAVKRCFIGGSDPRKENHDPLLLIDAYENKNHKVWQCHGDKMTWKDMDAAVQQAIAHRRKLGPLPKSQYANADGSPANPIVIYYYDNDKMKRITYPLESVPEALRGNNFRWWAWGSSTHGDDAGKAAGLDDVHTRETDDPKKIAAERARPGWTKGAKDNTGSAGDWQSEGPQWDKDVAGTGVIGSITGAILALVSAVLDATGVGAVVGVPLGIATPFVVAAINATDTALHAGDFGAALANLGPALVQAAVSAVGKGAGAAGIKIPPAALQALGGTVTAIAQGVAAGQAKKLDFGQIWAEVASKVKGHGKLGDDEAEAIATMLGGPGGKSSAAGHVFIQGYLAGKFLDMQALQAIAKLLQPLATYYDPRIINIALLGMGIGYLSQHEQGAPLPARATAAHAAKGDFAGQIFIEGRQAALDDLDSFVISVLAPRYGFLPSHVTGLECPPGFDLVATGGEIACAFRGKAACLAGGTGERGEFVCTARDFDCPPGMSTRRGSPSNWCFPVSGRVVGHAVGQAVPPPSGPPDWSWPALGCPHGYWRDDLAGQCRPLTTMPQPLPPLRTS